MTSRARWTPRVFSPSVSNGSIIWHGTRHTAQEWWRAQPPCCPRHSTTCDAMRHTESTQVGCNISSAGRREGSWKHSLLVHPLRNTPFWAAQFSSGVRTHRVELTAHQMPAPPQGSWGLLHPSNSASARLLCAKFAIQHKRGRTYGTHTNNWLQRTPALSGAAMDGEHAMFGSSIYYYCNTQLNNDFKPRPRCIRHAFILLNSSITNYNDRAAKIPYYSGLPQLGELRPKRSLVSFIAMETQGGHPHRSVVEVYAHNSEKT